MTRNMPTAKVVHTIRVLASVPNDKRTERSGKLYRRAYRETMAYDAKGKEKPWILAANNLAVALLRRDTFDVEILKP